MNLKTEAIETYIYGKKIETRIPVAKNFEVFVRAAMFAELEGMRLMQTERNGIIISRVETQAIADAIDRATIISSTNDFWLEVIESSLDEIPK